MDDDFLREVLGDRNKKPGAVATPDIAAVSFERRQVLSHKTGQIPIR